LNRFWRYLEEGILILRRNVTALTSDYLWDWNTYTHFSFKKDFKRKVSHEQEPKIIFRFR